MINNRLLLLIDSMIEFEGWHPVGAPGATPLTPSISYRNNNPGNLRSSPFALGFRDGFAVFYSSDVGRFAMVWDIWMKCHGRTSSGLTPDSTLSDLIRVYSSDPPDVVSSYINHVVSRTGFIPNLPIKSLVQ